MRPEDRETILTEVRSRVVKDRAVGAENKGVPLDEVLAESVYHEKRRLKEEPRSKAREADKEFWRDIQRALAKSSERELRSLLGRVVSRYAAEICGNFDERIYQLSTRILPRALGLVVNTVSPKRLVQRMGDLPTLDDAVVVQGETEHVRRLHEVGTLILAPTHVSNMDSMILGYAIYRLGLPPALYGAGLNLFGNPLLGFFMHNLGAYTVDRKKRDPVYKDVLKTYAGLTLEHGYNNLFFPGGTRGRSGAIEQKLKLGLLGTGLGAYINNLKRGAPRSKIFVVPATLSFQLCLEAETLIDDFLRDVGRSRYIITDDEFAQPKRVFDFITQLMRLDSKIYVTMSRGIDLFGNPVTDEGESLDPRGRHIDTTQYVMVNGEPQELPQRDKEYTQEVGDRIADAYMRDNVVQSTNVTARAVLSLLRAKSPNTDIVRLLRVGGKEDDVDLREVYKEVGRLTEELRGLAARGGVRLGEWIARGEPHDIVSDALRHFSTYHTTSALTRRGDRIFASDRMLTFYYQNRLEGYRLDRALGLEPLLSKDHRSLSKAS